MEDRVEVSAVLISENADGSVDEYEFAELPRETRLSGKLISPGNLSRSADREGERCGTILAGAGDVRLEARLRVSKGERLRALVERI